MLPGIALIGYVACAVTVFLVSDLRFLAVLSGLCAIAMTVLPFRKLKTGILPIGLFLAVTFAANVFFSTGRIVLEFGPVVVTEEGLVLAALRTLRVFLLIAAAKFLTVVTSIEDIIRVMGRFLRPLDRIGVPASDFFETMGLTVRAIPHIMRRLSDIYRRQVAAQGSSGIRERASVVVQFLIPVFVESIHDPGPVFREEESGGKRNEERAGGDDHP